MRTSATGTADGALVSRLSDERGFTLVELLIVLTIIGLMSAAVVLAMPDGRGGLRAEVERFAARASAAQDRALIEARPVAVRLTTSGYHFEQREDGEWQPLDREPFIKQQWLEGTQARMEAQGTRIVFDPTGVTEPAEFVVERQGQRLAVSIGHDGRIQIRG